MSLASGGASEVFCKAERSLLQRYHSHDRVYDDYLDFFICPTAT